VTSGTLSAGTTTAPAHVVSTASTPARQDREPVDGHLAPLMAGGLFQRLQENNRVDRISQTQQLCA
jgi:hypothetical protein